MAKQKFEPTADNIRTAIKTLADKRTKNFEQMRALADENDSIERRTKRLQKQLNDIVYPPHK